VDGRQTLSARDGVWDIQRHAAALDCARKRTAGARKLILVCGRAIPRVVLLMRLSSNP
jgi:hypothetical protein